MPPNPQKITALAPRPARDGRIARAAGLRKRLGAWITDLEYRLRVSRPFTYGSGARRVFFPGCSLPAADPALVMRAYECGCARAIPTWRCGPTAAACRSTSSPPRRPRRGATSARDGCSASRAPRRSSPRAATARCSSSRWRSPGPASRRSTGSSPRPTGAIAAAASRPSSITPAPRVSTRASRSCFRALADRLHLTVINADDAKHPLPCCLVRSPSATAKRQALADSKLITYCAHCTMSFQSDIPTRHVLQETFGSPDDRWAPRGKVSRFLRYLRFARLAASSSGAASPARAGAGLVNARSRWALGAILALVAVGLLAFAARELDLARRMLDLVSWTREAGIAGTMVYGIGYILSAVLLLPGSVLTLGAGFAWGPVLGVAVVSPASVLASTAAFLLGCTVLRAWVERRIGADPRVAAIDRAVGDNGLKLVLLLRLSPVLPFNLLNYALALTRVRLRDYVLGSAIGMFPGTVLFVYLGSLATSGSDLLSGHPPAGGAAGTAFYWGGLVATVAVVVLVSRIARAALREALREQAS